MFNEDFQPPAEEMYERLGDFFPGYGLGEPVIEDSSGGTSLTSAEAIQPLPTPDRRKHKKSIRVVANEHKRKLDRTSRITSANNAERLRDSSPEHDLVDEGGRIPHSAPVDPRDTSATFVSESGMSLALSSPTLYEVPIAHRFCVLSQFRNSSRFTLD